MRRLLSVFVVLLTVAFAPGALAGLPTGTPGQDSADGTQPGGNANGGTWSDLPGGIAARPYVKSLKVINGDAVVTVFSGGVGASATTVEGDVTSSVSPTNLCAAGQTPQQGRCYATPNRVGIALGYKGPGGSVDTDFSNPTVPVRQTVNADTVFDIVIGLNTLGKTLRWSWVNGDLLSWKTSNLGADDAEIRLRVKPVATPLYDYAALGPVGCTATPIRDCDIAQAGGSALSTNMFLSLDDSLGTELTGTAFGTTAAIAGFLVPDVGPAGPILDLQMGAAHLAADGSPMKGSLRAFLPSTVLTGLYGVQPADAGSFFTARRTTSGTSDAPTFETRAASAVDNDALVISIDNITFSAPAYRVATKAKPLSVKVATKGSKATVSSKALTACKKAACTITIYKAGKTFFVKPTKIAAAKSSATGALSATLAKSKLPAGTVFIVNVRKGKTLLASTRAQR